MSLQFLIDLLTGNLALVDVPPTSVAPSTGNFIFIGGEYVNFINLTGFDFVS